LKPFSIVGGTIPNNFLPAIEKGFKERIERGVIAGYRVQNVGVEVYFGKHHPVDSSEAAFKTAGSMARPARTLGGLGWRGKPAGDTTRRFRASQLYQKASRRYASRQG
jgi:hypothetical protein